MDDASTDNRVNFLLSPLYHKSRLNSQRVSVNLIKYNRRKKKLFFIFVTRQSKIWVDKIRHFFKRRTRTNHVIIITELLFIFLFLPEFLSETNKLFGYEL